MLLSSQHTPIPNTLNIDSSKTNPLFVLKNSPKGLCYKLNSFSFPNGTFPPTPNMHNTPLLLSICQSYKLEALEYILQSALL